LQRRVIESLRTGYDVAFQNGDTQWDIVVGQDGKLAGANFNPAP